LAKAKFHQFEKPDGDPVLPVAILQTGQLAKPRACELDIYKAAIGDLTQSAIM